MIVSKGGFYFRFSGGLSYDGVSWRGKQFMAGIDLSFGLTEPKFTCEPNPFPIDFEWPLEGMDGEGCQNEHLTFVDGAVTCGGGLNLVVSIERTYFVHLFTLSSVKWTGIVWNGWEKTTGMLLAFPKNIFFSCYNGVPPTRPPPTLPPTTGPTTTTVPTTTGPTTTGPTTTTPTTTVPTTTVPTTTAPTTTAPTTTGPTTTVPTTTVPVTTVLTTTVACGSYDPCGPLEGGAVIGCEGGRNSITCTASASIEIKTSSGIVKYDRMVFVFGHGWLSFSCDGAMKLWTTVEINAILSISCSITQN
ncbi:hypothetical protein PFISCL1PPCAC_13791 [Pristionchus fissidentatus]|uniref:C6 domain-containing protein n=1 Tax=Pristionchus fissidentatus TaxID=1538716 RepID=A0AAV5VXP2_9BILA|nr:hypothetical protein PFISCL1PPCAC_13791 [Pristionchus fissidentatus]